MRITTARLADGSEYGIGGEWAQISLFDAVSKAPGEQISTTTCHHELLDHAQRVGLAVHRGWLPGKLVEELFEHLGERDLYAPTNAQGLPAWTRTR